MDHDPVLDAVGQRLRSLRQQRQLTLAGLSATTGISVSTLSRLESGGRKPTLELLLALARAYQVPLDDMVGAPPVGDPRVRLQPFSRDGRTLISLTERPGGPRAYKMVVPPPEPDADAEQKAHEGYEWIYVLSGRLRLRLAEHDFVMKTGEVAEFDTRVPHWFGSAGPEPAEILVLFGPQGERMHIRARPKPAGSKPIGLGEELAQFRAADPALIGKRALEGGFELGLGDRAAAVLALDAPQHLVNRGTWVNRAVPRTCHRAM